MDNKLCLIVLDFKCLATTTIIFTHCACHSHSTENTSIIYTVHLSFVPTLWNRYLRVRFPSSQVFRLLVHEPLKKLAHAHKYSPWEVPLYLKFLSQELQKYCMFVRVIASSFTDRTTTPCKQQRPT